MLKIGQEVWAAVNHYGEIANTAESAAIMSESRKSVIEEVKVWGMSLSEYKIKKVKIVVVDE
jgi:hypothetical protein